MTRPRQNVPYLGDPKAETLITATTVRFTTSNVEQV